MKIKPYLGKYRRLTREDLPKNRYNANSLRIPVIHEGKEKFICDIHFGDQTLCWLEDAKGVPTPIRDLKIKNK